MLLSIIIPAYNERTFLPQVLQKVTNAPYDKEIIIVDDCSSDGTREYIQTLPSGPEANEAGFSTKIVGAFHQKNMGKGGAVKTALKHVTGDLILIQDADLEYDPKDYPKLLEPILDGNADVVYGSRFLGGPHRVFYFWHFIGNRLITLVSNMLTNLNLTDMETGYKVFRREVVEGVEIRSMRFGFEPEITAKMARKGCRIYEVPISYYGRSYTEGKKITWKDGMKAVFTILKYNIFTR